ncbi:protein kinase domain-containing protein [Acinetobacter nectaris]|uniref:protein kinase domain-containing protein n=1 Tax=Acinetobacter nectaris TaxID=1219382 RepID=UPI001F001367|nr:protein kinase [Acinetobacter nectaris]MCF9034165.1 protein kinase [Acinetobacter nectaris]
MNPELVSKSQSLKYGRRVFRFKKADEFYYLKCQSDVGHEQFKQGFKREYSFYIQHPMSLFLLPFEKANFITLDAFGLSENNAGFILPEAKSFFLNRSPSEFNIHEILEQVLKLCEPLENLHQAGYIHGDIKKEHFVEYAEHFCLLDFEHTVLASSENISNLSATPRYMAPELFHGQNKTVQTDLYALGIVLYEWLAQQRLNIYSYEEWAKLHCQQYFAQLPKVYCDLQFIIDGLLEKQKLNRFQTIAALKDSIYFKFM